MMNSNRKNIEESDNNKSIKRLTENDKNCLHLFYIYQKRQNV